MPRVALGSIGIPFCMPSGPAGTAGAALTVVLGNARRRATNITGRTYALRALAIGACKAPGRGRGRRVGLGRGRSREGESYRPVPNPIVLIVLIFGMSLSMVCAEMTCETKSRTCKERASSAAPKFGCGM